MQDLYDRTYKAFIIQGSRRKTVSKHTGWEREYRTHFDTTVAEYEIIRPEWISDIFDDIADGLCFPIILGRK